MIDKTSNFYIWTRFVQCYTSVVVRSTTKAQAAQIAMRLRGRDMDGLYAKRIPGLDTIRAFAVGLVILSHFGLPVNGGVGVLAFFVLSGFIITWLLLSENEPSLARFYKNRVARILPPFFGYAALAMTYSYVRGLPMPWEPFMAATLYCMNYYHALFNRDSTVFSHCWSLAVEEQFYILWPIIFVTFRRDHRNLVRFLVVSIIVTWALRLTLWFGFDVPDSYLYRALENRADQLAIGCLLAISLKHGYLVRFFSSYSKYLIAPTIGLLWLVASGDQDLDLRYSVCWIVDAILVAALIPQMIVTNVDWAPISYLGQISYGLYLFQQLLLHPITKATEQLPVAVQLLASSGTVIAVSAVSYHLWEQPIRRFIRGLRWRTTDTSVGISGDQASP